VSRASATGGRPAGPAVVAAVALAAAGLGLALAGCTVGSGSGSATGPLWVVGCNMGEDFGTPAMPAAYDLHPTFFAADPIDDLSQGTNINRLVIRMQRTGQSIEYNDALYFDVENSFQIASCVRGTTDPATGFDPTDMGLGPWCDTTGAGLSDGGAPDGGVADAGAGSDGGAGADGGTGAGCAFVPGVPRILITSQGYMQSSLQLLATCPLNVFTGSGTAVTGHAVTGWIQFLDFGSAAQSNVLPADRTPVPTDFKVNYGERLHANFCEVHMVDDRVVTAEQTQPAGPVPAPLLGGTLSGTFDFDLIRGRAAQPFP
jgi:hypothetical protein